MESFMSHSSSVKQTSSSKFSSSISPKDLWSATRLRSVAEVDSALLSLKKNARNVNLRNASGVTPLHITVWKNHVLIVKRLLGLILMQGMESEDGAACTGHSILVILLLLVFLCRLVHPSP